MALVACKCTSCGGTLKVDDSKDAAICEFCGTPFIVEKAIQYYKTVNVTMNQMDEKTLVRKGLRILEDIYFNRDELLKLAEDLSNLSTDDFYPEMFFFFADNKDNSSWLLKNSTDEEKKLMIPFLYNQLIRDYNKESFEEIHLNILKNYEGVNFENKPNDRSWQAMNLLAGLTPFFTSEEASRFEHLKEMADAELHEILKNPDQDSLFTAMGYAEAFPSIVSESLKDEVMSCLASYARSIRMDEGQFEKMYSLAGTLKGYGLDYSFFKYRVADGFYLYFDHIEVKGRRLALEYPLAMVNTGGEGYMLLKVSPTEATVIELKNCQISPLRIGVMPCLKIESMEYFDSLVEYKETRIREYDCALVYQEGFSYRRSKMEKVFGFFSKLIK